MDMINLEQVVHDVVICQRQFKIIMEELFFKDAFSEPHKQHATLDKYISVL